MTGGLNQGDGWLTCFRPRLRIETFIIGDGSGDGSWTEPETGISRSGPEPSPPKRTEWRIPALLDERDGSFGSRWLLITRRVTQCCPARRKNAMHTIQARAGPEPLRHCPGPPQRSIFPPLAWPEQEMVDSGVYAALCHTRRQLYGPVGSSKSPAFDSFSIRARRKKKS